MEICMIKSGKKVSLEYTVFLEDGTQIDSNVGEDPLTFVLGSNQVFPALEQALTGLKVGDTKQIFLKAEEAYGPIVPEAFKEVDLEAVPTPFRYPGAVLGVQDPAGGVYPIRVHEIKDQKAILDFNHPLAGRSLNFHVKVVEVI
jgi:FKBP-type peptidyl-prolyl cis-trans isomerase 2